MAKLTVLKLLIISAIVFSFSFTRQADAGFLTKLFTQIASAINAVTSHFNSVLNVVTDCEDANIDGIKTKCFSPQENNKIREALNTISSHKYLVFHNNKFNDVHDVIKQSHTIANWSANQIRRTYLLVHFGACDNNDGKNFGCHLAGTTFISSGGLQLENIRFSAALIHEADHATGSIHSCGGKADKNLDGAYGIEALYFMSQYLDSNSALSVGEKSLAYARAVSIANYQMCEVPENRSGILNYKLGPPNPRLVR